MSTRVALLMVTAGSLFAFTGSVTGQEVNSDVKIPAPRELVTGTPVINGFFVGPDSLFRSDDQIFRGSVGRASVGILNEAQTRTELGDFMTSLLVRAEVIAFDRLPARLADSEEGSENGSRPAWTGPTPITLTAGMRGRAESVRRR